MRSFPENKVKIMASDNPASVWNAATELAERGRFEETEHLIPYKEKAGPVISGAVHWAPGESGG